MSAKEPPAPTLVSLLAGTITGRNLKLAKDLASILDGPDFRILPILGKGSLQGAADLLDLQVIDLATLQSNVIDFDAVRRERGSVGDRLSVIAKLFNEEMHVLAPRSIGSIDQLVGKRVNFGPKSSGGHATSRLVFDALGIAVDVQEREQTDAPAALHAGEIDALCRVVGSPVEDFRAMTTEQGMHLLPVPADRIKGAYLGVTFDSQLYPALVAEDHPVPGIAVASLLAARRSPDDRAAMTKLRDLVQRLRAALPELRSGAFHEKWAETELDVTLPGWQRFDPALTT